MKRYRVGVIGHTGRGNYGHGLDTVWLELPECEIVAVADPHETGLAAAIKRLGSPMGFADYRKMLDECNLDIVAIGPRWLDQHRDMAIAAAQRGIHIYMEKPFCRTLQEADEIVAACEKNEVKLAVAHQTRWSPKLQVVSDLIEDGEIGEVLEFRARGKEDRRGGGEDLWVLGSHVLNLINYFGGEPLWCFASVKQGGRPITKEDVAPGNEGIGLIAGDDIDATYRMSGGAMAYFASRRNAAGGRYGLQIFGTKGVIEILTGYLPAVQILRDSTWSPGRTGKRWESVSTAGIGKPESVKDPRHQGGNLMAVRDLIDSIEQDRYPECNVFEGRTTVEMIAAVFESHRLGKAVNFPLANRKNPLESL